MLTPVLLNVAIILATAIAVNGCFAWRRYPGRLGRAPAARTTSRATRSARRAALSHSDFEYALHEIDSTVGVSEGELARIHRLASAHARSDHLEPWQIRRHHFYSNGHYGAEWSIRKIVEDDPHDEPGRDFVTWLAVDGSPHRPTGNLFAQRVRALGAPRGVSRPAVVEPRDV